MNVMIESESRENGGHYITATCGSINAFASKSAWGSVTVCCNNAAHRTWKGGGRTFPTVEAALAHYKKPELKAIIGFLANN